jgi:hypothetical protein
VNWLPLRVTHSVPTTLDLTVIEAQRLVAAALARGDPVAAGTPLASAAAHATEAIVAVQVILMRSP